MGFDGVNPVPVARWEWLVWQSTDASGPLASPVDSGPLAGVGVEEPA